MNLGLVFQQGDGVLIFVFLLLVGMSIATWSIIIWRAYRLIKAKKPTASKQKNSGKLRPSKRRNVRPIRNTRLWYK